MRLDEKVARGLNGASWRDFRIVFCIRFVLTGDVKGKLGSLF